MSKKEEIEAQRSLAAAMNRLAERIEGFQDPVWIQRVMGDAFRGMAAIEGMQNLLAPVLPPGVTIESVRVTLSDEDREKLSEKVYQALQPQLEEFDHFVRESLEEMPPHRLKTLAEAIEKGAKPKLARRRGCIYIEMDGLETYLGL